MQHTTLAVAVAVALTLVAPAALAQDRETPEQRTSTLDTLIVTGTRVADRTVAESSSPIDIITPETLQATGTTELATALSRALPSLNFPRPAVTDGTSAIRPAQLRGLAPDQVLVLVNGKRRHTTALLNVNGTQGRGSSPVDLNAIPIAAIERVEVLRDGASAQYGSDAIAGVINVVLKGSGASGGGIDARYGQYSAGDGAQWNLAGDHGMSLGQDGFLHLAAQFGEQDPTNRARPYAGTAPGGNNAQLGEKRFMYGDPEVEHWGLSFNAEMALGDSATLYGFGMASERDITSFAFFRAPGNPNQNVPQVHPDGFVPQINNIADDRSMVAGVRGDSGGWNWDLSYNWGFNHLEFFTRNTVNASLGPASPTSFYAGALETTQNIFNLDVSRALDWGLAYPVNLALGAEYREEKWNQSPGEPDSCARVHCRRRLLPARRGSRATGPPTRVTTSATAMRCMQTLRRTSPSSSRPVRRCAMRTTATSAARRPASSRPALRSRTRWPCAAPWPRASARLRCRSRTSRPPAPPSSPVSPIRSKSAPSRPAARLPRRWAPSRCGLKSRCR